MSGSSRSAIKTTGPAIATTGGSTANRAPACVPALAGLSRYIATVETAKHRFFVFLDAAILPDNMLVNIALDDAYFLGVLSSRAHVVWALATGGRFGRGQRSSVQQNSLF